MRIRIDTSFLGETKWSDNAIRFLFGGMITAAAGIVAKKFGPGIGGLLLAFPVIFPASRTLIEKNAREKKRQAGLNGKRRGRMEAAVDAAGGAIGTLGLLVLLLMAAIRDISGRIEVSSNDGDRIRHPPDSSLPA